MPIEELQFGNGVSLAEAKRAFLSGMSSEFRKTVKVKFIKSKDLNVLDLI